ncbi:MAG: hypothetical protein HYX27_01035 [Acidobacteria bacterium]|nr:hypothetical protein [Acidobacteriota bacterium]
MMPTRFLAAIAIFCMPVSVWAAKPRKVRKETPHYTEKGVKTVAKGTARATDHTIYGVGKGVKAVGKGMKWMVT